MKQKMRRQNEDLKLRPLPSLDTYRMCLSHLSLVNNVSYGADHARRPRAKCLFDPLLLQSRAQLAHGQVALRHLKLTLEESGKGPEEM